MIMQLYLSIMNQTILVISKNQQIINYISGKYKTYAFKSLLSNNVKRINMDEILCSNTQIKETEVIDNSIISILNSDDSFYMLHAGIVSDGNDAYLLCGKTKSGKSTACFLLQNMFNYMCMSDDLAFIHKKELWVSSLGITIKLRAPIVEKYKLQSQVRFCEYDSDGVKRFIFEEKTRDKLQCFNKKKIKAIIEVEYVNDIKLQSIEEIHGFDAIHVLLFNSYMQNRLSTSYGVIIELIKRVKVYRVRYCIPSFLNDFIQGQKDYWY